MEGRGKEAPGVLPNRLAYIAARKWFRRGLPGRTSELGGGFPALDGATDGASVGAR